MLNCSLTMLEVARTRNRRWPVQLSSWAAPPVGVLNLNFDASFISDARKGGFEGVIGTSIGASLVTYSVSIDWSDPNQVEVFAMLVGCNELVKQGSHYAIIEGNSFSAIQWGSGKSIYLCRVAGWVEEIQHISALSGCSFNHVLREVNDLADGFSREGAAS